MNTYYLVPVGEYETFRSSHKKQPTNRFDQATSSVVNAVCLSEKDRAEQLRDLLNKYLNYKSTAKVKFESDIEGIVRKVVGIMDSVPIAASRQAVPVTSVSVPVTAAPPSPVTPTVVKPQRVNKVQNTSRESEIKNPTFHEEDEFQDADTTFATSFATTSSTSMVEPTAIKE